MNILLVTSSPRGEASLSTRLARELAERLAWSHPGASLAVRDLNHEPLPFIEEGFTGAIYVPAEARTEQQQQALAVSDRLVAELQQADVIVIGSGMINFGVPAALKAWIDQVARAGLTFTYTSGGPKGLLQGKKTYLVLTSGGVYSNGPAAGMDFQRPYLTAVLGFLGLTDVEVVLAEGVAKGPDAAGRALELAGEQIARIAAGTQPSERVLVGV